MASPSLRSPAVLLCVLVVLGGCAGTPFGSPTLADSQTADAPDSPSPPASASSSAADSAAASLTPHPAVAPTVTAEVVRVIDGDTVEVRFENGTRSTVRLLGVDTPEVRGDVAPEEYEGVPNTTAGRECLRRHADAASAYVDRVAGGDTVRLAFDPESPRRGFYDRLLAYTYVREGGEWRQLNYRLLTRGHARLYESTFVERDRYAAAERRARAAGRGLWACAPSGTPVADGGAPGDDASASPSTAPPGEPGSLVVAAIHADAAGDDNRNLNDEYVVLRNDGAVRLDLSGWTVTDAAGKTYEFPPGATLRPGESLTLHTGHGETRPPDYYWGRESAVWNNDGDTVTVRRDDGRTVAVRRY